MYRFTRQGRYLLNARRKQRILTSWYRQSSLQWDCVYISSQFDLTHLHALFTTHALGTFQRTMEVILSFAQWQYALLYLDYLSILLGTTQERTGHVRKVLTLLRDAKVTPKLKICKFFNKTIDYLGHAIHRRCLEFSPHMTKAIRGPKASSILMKVWSFLRLCNDFRQFVQNFAGLAAPLNQRLKKGQAATIRPHNKEGIHSMNLLKKAFVSLRYGDAQQQWTRNTWPRRV